MGHWLTVSSRAPTSNREGSSRGIFHSPSLETDKVTDNKDFKKWIDNYLGVGEWVMDQSVVVLGSSGWFERKRWFASPCLDVFLMFFLPRGLSIVDIKRVFQSSLVAHLFVYWGLKTFSSADAMLCAMHVCPIGGSWLMKLGLFCFWMLAFSTFELWGYLILFYYFILFFYQHGYGVLPWCVSKVCNTAHMQGIKLTNNVSVPILMSTLD